MVILKWITIMILYRNIYIITGENNKLFCAILPPECIAESRIKTYLNVQIHKIKKGKLLTKCYRSKSRTRGAYYSYESGGTTANNFETVGLKSLISINQIFGWVLGLNLNWPKMAHIWS